MEILIDFVRHGQSCGNVGVYHEEKVRRWGLPLDPHDPVVTNRGLAQSQALRRFGPLPQQPDCVVVSPQVRAIDTAQALYPHERLVVAPFLKEDSATLEGQLRSVADWTDYCRNHDVDPRFLLHKGRWHPDAHTSDPRRFLRFLAERVVPEAGICHLVVVTHAKFLRTLFHSESQPYNLAVIRMAYRRHRGTLQPERSHIPHLRVPRPTRYIVFPGHSTQDHELHPDDVDRCHL